MNQKLAFPRAFDGLCVVSDRGILTATSFFITFPISSHGTIQGFVLGGMKMNSRLPCGLPLLLSLWFLLHLFGILTPTHALAIEGRIVLGPVDAPPPTKVILNGGMYATLSAADGSFRFVDVPTGKPSLGH